jgi:hypothetical protein
MTISEFSVHNVLRTYNKQFKIGKLVRGGNKSSDPKAVSDEVEISTESRRLAFIKSISLELTEKLGEKVTEKEVEEKVSQNIEQIINDLAKESSPEDMDFIENVKVKLLELF